VLARSVYLSFGNLELNVSDNYFNLLPGETTEITATGPASLDQLRAKLQVRSLADAFPGDDQR
jgi:beta-mannosidase